MKKILVQLAIDLIKPISSCPRNPSFADTKKCLNKNYHKINVRPVGNAAQDIHNRAIKSATDWFEFFTLAFILTKDRIEKNDLQLR